MSGTGCDDMWSLEDALSLAARRIKGVVENRTTYAVPRPTHTAAQASVLARRPHRTSRCQQLPGPARRPPSASPSGDTDLTRTSRPPRDEAR
eukprot:scaffold62227_cov75-Phaeocystis_antarctica.AAC.1